MQFREIIFIRPTRRFRRSRRVLDCPLRLRTREDPSASVLNSGHSCLLSLNSLSGVIRMSLRFVLVLLVLALPGSITRAQQPQQPPRAIAVDDLFGVEDVSDAQISPDGQFVTYTVDT